MDDLVKVEEIAQEIKENFAQIAISKPPYVLEHLIVKERDTEPEQWSQCIWEMKARYFEIKRQLLFIQKAELRAQACPDTDIGQINRELILLQKEEMGFRLLGLTREFFALYRIYKSFGKRYSRAELDAAQEEYWFKRLSRQATQDILASGRVSVSNQDALRQIGAAVKVANGAIEFQRQKGLEAGKEKAPEGAGG